MIHYLFKKMNKKFFVIANNNENLIDMWPCQSKKEED